MGLLIKLNTGLLHTHGCTSTGKHRSATYTQVYYIHTGVLVQVNTGLLHTHRSTRRSKQGSTSTVKHGSTTVLANEHTHGSTIYYP